MNAATARADTPAERVRAMTDAVLAARAYRFGFGVDAAPDAAQAAREQLWRRGMWDAADAFTLQEINGEIKHAYRDEWRRAEPMRQRRGERARRRARAADVTATNGDGDLVHDAASGDNTERAALARVSVAQLVRRADGVLTDNGKRVLIFAACGRTERETADALGVSQQTVNKHKRRAVARLAATLAREGVSV